MPRNRKRLFQLQLQHAGAFALLGQNEAFAKLEITDEQRQRFMTVVREMETKIRGLTQDAESSGRPKEIMPKIRKVRTEHEGKIEAILSDTQKRQWQLLLGKAFILDD